MESAYHAVQPRGVALTAPEALREYGIFRLTERVRERVPGLATHDWLKSPQQGSGDVAAQSDRFDLKVHAPIAFHESCDAVELPKEATSLALLQDVLPRAAEFFYFLNSCGSGDAVPASIIYLNSTGFVIRMEYRLQKAGSIGQQY